MVFLLVLNVITSTYFVKMFEYRVPILFTSVLSNKYYTGKERSQVEGEYTIFFVLNQNG